MEILRRSLTCSNSSRFPSSHVPSLASRSAPHCPALLILLWGKTRDAADSATPLVPEVLSLLSFFSFPLARKPTLSWAHLLLIASCRTQPTGTRQLVSKKEMNYWYMWQHGYCAEWEKPIHTVRFHLYKILRHAGQRVVTESTSCSSGEGRAQRGGGLQRSPGKPLTILITVLISWRYTRQNSSSCTL